MTGFSVFIASGGLDFLNDPESASAQVSPDRPVQPGQDVFDKTGLASSPNLKVDTPYALPGMDMYTMADGGYFDPINMDINGDGLTDMVVSNYYNMNDFRQAVMLSTGTGYNLDYVCIRQWDGASGQYKYWGDCADA